MKKLLFPIFIVFLGSFWGYGQHRIRNLEELNGFNAIPKETVFVHSNDNLFLSGEYLYYKLYCLNAEDRAPSKISKIGYVELVGKSGESVFRHKIRLTDGMGQGDFFMPVNLASGHYKLTGYTQWMLNEGAETIFIDDVIIINPYLNLPDAAASTSHNIVKLVKKSSAIQPFDSTVLSKTADSTFLMELPKRTFGKRKRVTIKFINLGRNHTGNYSISVRKRNLVGLPSNSNTAHLLMKSNNPRRINPSKINDRIYLPELRGELISGKIVSKMDGSPISNQDISLSISGNGGVAKISRTDENGVFYFNLDESDRKSDMLLEALESSDAESEIILNSPAPLNLESADFKQVIVSPELNPLILERSVFNQVESAFFEQKADNILVVNSGIPVYRNFQETYVLDDYKRFKTFNETLVEIVENVLIRRINGKQTLQVRNEDEFFVDSGDTPLLLIDGLMVQDLKNLLEYDIKKIVQINISRDEYYIGPKKYQGIVSIDTRQDDYAQQIEVDNLSTIKVDAPLPLKEYYFQDYSGISASDKKHIADFRQQLLWKPNLELNKETILEFYTSDNTGDFDIRIEGFTSKGQAVSLSETIHVE